MRVHHRLAVAVPFLPQLLVVAAGLERVAGEVEVVALRLAVEIGRGRRRFDGAARPVQRDVGVSEDGVDRERPVRLAVAAFVGLLLEGEDRRIAVGQPLVGGGGAERGRHKEAGQEEAERGYPRATSATPVYGVIRMATSYFSTPVRVPGVSLVGIALRISSPRL